MINLIHGDYLEVLKTIPDESVDAVVTDPPYGILNHKIESGVDIPAFFKECKRVLKPNSFIVFFGQQPTLTHWNIEGVFVLIDVIHGDCVSVMKTFEDDKIVY